MNPVLSAHGRAETADGVLVQEAVAGSGESFAALYDRYEQGVFNFCLRLTGSREDAADATQEAFLGVFRRLRTDDSPVLDFRAYLYTAARNESHRLGRRGSRATPVEDAPEARDPTAAPPDIDADPVRSVLLSDSQQEVRAANARLSPRHREVLALRELAGSSYEEIGAILGISANAAAQLLFRSRARLREELNAEALGSVAVASGDCERAQLLLGMREDGEPLSDAERDWLDEHLDECGNCRAARAMLAEVGASYRSWLPVVAVAGLREDTIARAGELVGANWTAVAAPPGRSHAAHAAAGAGGVAAAGLVALALAGALTGDDPETVPGPAAGPQQAARGAATARAAPRAPARPSVSTARARRPPAPAASPAVSRPQALAPEGEPRDVAETPPRRRPAGPPHDRTTSPRPPAATPAPVAQPQPPAMQGPCTHPGAGGPAGCPPGHGGTPPGQGGSPPGLGGLTPGQGGPPPGRSGP